MKAKLIKKIFSGGGYEYILHLENEKSVHAKSGVGHGWLKLSKQKCDEIFGVVDVEKLADEYFLNEYSFNGKNNLPYKDSDVQITKNDFKKGFNTAMELNKDKVTLEKFINSYIEKTGYGMDMWSEEENKVMTTIATIIESLQQPTEIEVEIEMKNSRTGKIIESESDLGGDENGLCDKSIPKLDPNGCLILKKL